MRILLTPYPFSKMHLLMILALFALNTAFAQEKEAADSQIKFVNVDKGNPDAVVLDEPDRFADPIKVLDYIEEVEVLDEEKGGYVKVRVKVNRESKEGWVKKSILSDKRPEPIDAEAAEAEGASATALGVKGSVGMDPVDMEGFENESQQNPWDHIDPTSADAKLKGSSVPYYLIIPAGVIIAGGVLVLARTNKDSEPDPPVDDPIVEDPEFTLLDDSYSVSCGQSLLIYPLQNDLGTGLIITGINDAPEGVELVDNITVSIPATLSEAVSFTIDIEDEVGQTGTSTVNVSVDEVGVVANNDEYEINQGDVVANNVLSNDFCLGCQVVEASGEIGTLEMAPNGDFQYFSPADYWGQVVYTITIQNPCGAEDISDLIFIISPTGCDLVMADDTLWLNSGETIEGNLLDNDTCTDCVVTSVSDAEGTLEWDAGGNFSYSAPDNFEGQVVFIVSVSNACDEVGAQNLVFIVANPPCAFKWGGQVETTSAGCGFSNGAALATEELFGSYNFSWSNGVEGIENTNLSADTYQLFVTDTITGCADTLEAIVDELPPEYALDVEILTGECGATDNVHLFSNADVDQPLTVVLSGATDGIIENVTDPAIWLADFVTLNPGPLTITVWAEEAGPDCAQFLDLLLEQAPVPELVVLDTAPELIVLEINNAVFPVEIFVDGEPFMIAEEPMVFLEGLPPGTYEIFCVDATGCVSPTVVVVLDGGGIQKPSESLRWVPQAMGLNSWMQLPDQLIMETAEGQEGYFPVGNQTDIPVFIELRKGQWVAAGAASSNVYQATDALDTHFRRVNYFELSAGRQFKIFESTVSIKLGKALWNPRGEPGSNVEGWFIDGTTSLELKANPGRIHVGFRVGLIESSPQIMVIPNVQYSF